MVLQKCLDGLIYVRESEVLLLKLFPFSQFRRSSNQNSSAEPPVPDFGGTRSSITTEGSFGALPRKTLRDLGLDDRQLKSLSVFELMDRLIDAHPDLSYALWNFLRIGNSGYSFTVKELEGGERSEQGEEYINEFLTRLETPNMLQFDRIRSLDKIVDQLILSVITRGAAACELVLTPDLSDASFIAPVDPATIDFVLENGRYIPYQDNESVSLDIPTFIYDGMDEKIDSPYGRSPFVSALNIILFQLQVLNDIKAVVHRQGYPRLDIKIVEKVLLSRMPIAIRNNEEKKQKWLNDRLREIINMYNNLEPDDTFVHFDSLEIGEAGGKGSALIDPEKLMHVIDNLIMSGLKTLSTILGRRSTGNTESFAKLEIKLYLAGLSGVQRCVERVLNKAFTLYLNIRGQQGIVEFKFKPIEIRTALEAEQFRSTQINNLISMYKMGWVSHEDAARAATGHDPAESAPLDLEGSTRRNADGGVVGPTTDENPDAGGGNDS